MLPTHLLLCFLTKFWSSLPVWSLLLLADLTPLCVLDGAAAGVCPQCSREEMEGTYSIYTREIIHFLHQPTHNSVYREVTPTLTVKIQICHVRNI